MDRKDHGFPYIQKSSMRSLKSDADKVSLVYNEFEESVRSQNENLSAMYEAWDAYFVRNGSQWEKEKLAKLKAQKRDARVYDIIGPKVDTLAGAIIAEMPDLDWLPVEGQKSTATEAIKDSWYEDRELTNSEYEFILTVRDGLVHSGWCQMYETMEYGKPVIGIGRVMPGFFVPSSYWIQQSDRKLEVGFKLGYLTPEQMAYKYCRKADEIENAMEIIRKMGVEEMPSNAYEMRRRYVGRIADHYLVIEKHYVERVRATRLVGVRVEVDISGEPTGKVKWVPFPVTDDRDKLEIFAATNGIDWETVEETTYVDTIHRVDTVVPDFDRSLLLENEEKSKIQTKGIPFYHFTVSRYNGIDKGIVGSMLDPQRTINERESLISELIEKANGGSNLIDKNVFRDQKDRDDFSKNKNTPGYDHYVDMSQSSTGSIVVPVSGNDYPSQVLNQIARMYDQVVPMTSRVSDSMSAISKSGKSGILFEREIEVNRIGNLLMDKSLKNMLDHIAGDYFYQWQISYAGIEKEVTSRDGKKGTVLNERFIDSKGCEMIRNAVDYVPRCRALVTESTRSPTYQMRYRSLYGELLQTIRPDVSLEHFNYVFNRFMMTLDLPEKDKAELEALNKTLDVKSKMNMIKDIVGINAQTKEFSVKSASSDIQLYKLMAEMQNMGIGGVDQGQSPVPEQINEISKDVVGQGGAGGGIKNEMPGESVNEQQVDKQENIE